MHKYFQALISFTTESSTSSKSHLCACGILCDFFSLGSGAAADSVASIRKHIANCQIPAWSPFALERPSTFCLKESINIFKTNTLAHDRILDPTLIPSPHGILCGSCPLGSGAAAESAGQHPQAHLRLSDPHVVSLRTRQGGHRLGGCRPRSGLDDHLRPLCRLPRWRPARLRHQALRPGERLRAVQLLRRSGGLHQVRVAGRVREGG